MWLQQVGQAAERELDLGTGGPAGKHEEAGLRCLGARRSPDGRLAGAGGTFDDHATGKLVAVTDERGEGFDLGFTPDEARIALVHTSILLDWRRAQHLRRATSAPAHHPRDPRNNCGSPQFRRGAGEPSLFDVATYMIETYISRAGAGELEPASSRLRA